MKNSFDETKELRLKFFFNQRIGGAWGGEPEEGNSFVCIRAADFETDELRHKTFDLTRRSYKDDEISNKSLKVGDIIIEKSGGGENQPVGRVVLFSLDDTALCSNFLELLRPDKKKVNSKFAAYLMYSLWATRLVTKAIKQTTGIQNLDVDEYFDFKVSLPDLSQQELVAKFLDKEISYIDTLIKAKHTLLSILTEKRQSLTTNAVTKGIISKVKLKDSGIEWLGKVPEHWEIKKIKYVTTKIGSGVTPLGGAQIYQKEGVPILRSQNIHFEGLKLDDVAFIAVDIHESMANSKVEYGDVLLNITGASIGRCYYFEGQFPEANVNQHVCILRPGKKILTEYLYLFLASDLGQNQIAVSQEGGGREGLNFESLKDFSIPLPPVNEQKDIINSVGESRLNIQALKENTNRSIELLKEKRTTLITASVTGQIEIV